MKQLKFLIASVFVLTTLNTAKAQWTASGNNVYNTNFSYGTYGTIPLKGKVGIGFNTLYNDNPPYTYDAVLQVKGIAGIRYTTFNIPLPTITISADNSPVQMNLAVGDGTANNTGGFIHVGGNPLNLMTRSLNIISGDNNGPADVTIPQGILKIGNVTTNNSYKLFVEKGILTEKVKVAVKGTANWADYVFNKDYTLLSLGEVEAYVKKNQHLPGVPSAEEVVKEGIDMATMDAKLLEKIEELTLYMIEMKKENEHMKKDNDVLKNRVQSLESKINQ